MEITEADIIRMKESLAGIQDPRREWGNLRHKLIDMLIIALTTISIGEHDFDAMEDWGREREVNLDGKTLWGSGKAGSQEALHVVSAWVGERNLVLGQVRTEEKAMKSRQFLNY